MPNTDAPPAVDGDTATTLVELLLRAATAVYGKAVQSRKVRVALKQYGDIFRERYGTLKILGMSEPVSLETLFTAVHIVNPSYREHFESVAGLHSQYVEAGVRKFSRKLKRLDGIEAANSHQRLNILGPPGSGKSTFLRRVGLAALSPETHSIGFKHACLPVFVELRRTRYETIDLLKIVGEEMGTFGFPSQASLVEELLNEGRFLILLDGLDEVPDETLDYAIRHIQQFVDKYRHNRFITSCRTAFYKNYFKRFVDVELAEFSDQQIRIFLGHWFSREEDEKVDTAARVWKLLCSEIHSPTLELARTPLLLTFICLVYDNNQKLPRSRALLYREALRILMERWSAEKRVHADGLCQQLSSEFELLMLGDIAREAYNSKTFFFREAELTKRIATIMTRDVKAPKEIRAERILAALEGEQGLLVQRAKSIYSFSHLTIQEFLAAHSFLACPEHREQLLDKAFDARWHEILTLMAGLGRADELLLQLLSKLNELQRGDKGLASFLRIVTRVINDANGSEEENLCRRAKAMWLIGSTINPLCAPHAVEDSLPRLAGLNERVTILDYDLSKPPNESCKAALLHVRDILGSDWLKGTFKDDLVSIKGGLEGASARTASMKNEERSRSGTSHMIRRLVVEGLALAASCKCSKQPRRLDDYCYGARLIWDCAAEAESLSRSTWEDITAALLRPNSDLDQQSTPTLRRAAARPRRG